MPDSDSSLPTLQYPEWQADYQAALLELDPKKLFERVAAAEAVIFNRLQALAQNPDHSLEHQAIDDALASLRVLKQQKLDYPDWSRKASFQFSPSRRAAFMAESNPLPTDSSLVEARWKLDARWKQLYAAAVLELDDTKLPRRIAEARAAMLDRANDSLANSSGEERRALNDAFRILRVLEETITKRKPAA
jgi:hypothetical protein